MSAKPKCMTPKTAALFGEVKGDEYLVKQEFNKK